MGGGKILPERLKHERNNSMCVNLESTYVQDGVLARERGAKSQLSEEVQRALCRKVEEVDIFTYTSVVPGNTVEGSQ